MTIKPQFRRWAPAVVVMCAGLLLRLIVAWRDLLKQLPTTLPDDAFYDFGIAHQIALGHTPSTDGITPTNGYHPLWVALLSAVYRFTGDDLIRPIHWAMTLGAVFDMAACVALLAIARELRLRPAIRFALVAWFALNPYQILVATGGLESSLALALGLGLVWLEMRTAPRGVRAVLTGVVAGLAVLARTDQTILVAALAAWRVIHARGAAERASRLSWVARAGAAMAAVVAPWLIYSYATTGTIIQSSALALPWIVHHLPLAYGHESIGWTLATRRALASTYDGVLLTARATGLDAIGAVFASGAALAVWASARDRPRRALAARLRHLGAFPWAMLALFGAHAAVRLVYRGWYPPPIVAAWALIVAIAVDHVARFGRLGRIAGAVATVAVLWLMYASARREIDTPMYGTFSYSLGPPQSGASRVADTDDGIGAYFAVRGQTNIDGIVNRRAFDALASGHLIDYLAEQKFSRIGATDYYHSSVFFGPRYRERLCRSEENPFLVRFVKSAAEKDSLIRLSANPVLLGSRAGREYLDDGWFWTADSRGDGLAISVGSSSELMFSLPDRPAPKSWIAIALRAAFTGSATGSQRVQFFLNGERIGERAVPPTLSVYRLLAPSLVSGRNHLRLVYGTPGVPQPDDRAIAWSYSFDNLVRAVDAGMFALIDGRSLLLPPSGPSFSQPGGDAVLDSGWLPLDRGQTPAAWAIGNASRIRFWAGHVDSERTLTLRLGPPPPTAEGAGQHITVALNGTSLGAIDLVPGEVRDYSLRVPAGTLLPSLNMLELRFARVAPDANAGVSRAAYLFGVSID